MCAAVGCAGRITASMIRVAVVASVGGCSSCCPLSAKATAAVTPCSKRLLLPALLLLLLDAGATVRSSALLVPFEAAAAASRLKRCRPEPSLQMHRRCTSGSSGATSHTAASLPTETPLHPSRAGRSTMADGNDALHMASCRWYQHSPVTLLIAGATGLHD